MQLVNGQSEYRPAEINYPTHEQEMLAIIASTKHWYPQLTGAHFTILSDHAPLQYWKTQRDLSKRQITWSKHLIHVEVVMNNSVNATTT